MGNKAYLYSAKKLIVRFGNEVNDKQKIGTCFFVQKQDIFFLITNRHLLDINRYDDIQEDYRIKEIFFETIMPDGNIQRVQISHDNIVFHPNPNNDLACIKNPKLISPKSVGLMYPVGYDFLARKEELDNNLLPGDLLVYAGYPKFFDTHNNTAILRSGIVASDPVLNYKHQQSATYGDVPGDVVAYEGFSSGGSSGSPIFAIQKGVRLGESLTGPADFYRRPMLVGINNAHFQENASQHSGISTFVKSSAIIELVDSL